MPSRILLQNQSWQPDMIHPLETTLVVLHDNQGNGQIEGFHTQPWPMAASVRALGARETMAEIDFLVDFKSPFYSQIQSIVYLVSLPHRLNYSARLEEEIA